jgi:hypothetical protein
MRRRCHWAFCDSLAAQEAGRLALDKQGKGEGRTWENRALEYVPQLWAEP